MDIEVLTGGICTTVQDFGRMGYGAYGVSPSGAVDPFAYAVSNILVGNERTAAALETTLNGPELRIHRRCNVALTGANFFPHINGSPVDMWRGISVFPGDILSFRGYSSGARCYIAFSGGISVPRVLGSYATDLRAGIGGHHGRRIILGDVLDLGPSSAPWKARILPRAYIPDYSDPAPLRVIEGPQAHLFDAEAIALFFSASYTVSEEWDRMGTRLNGPPIACEGGTDILSDGMAFGAIQVPGNGSPIIMLSERQATGGYAKIACVIYADLPRLAQLEPGDSMTFKRISVHEAHEALIRYSKRLNAIEALCEWQDTFEPKHFTATVSGRRYTVSATRIE